MSDDLLGIGFLGLLHFMLAPEVIVFGLFLFSLLGVYHLLTTYMFQAILILPPLFIAILWGLKKVKDDKIETKNSNQNSNQSIEQLNNVKPKSLLTILMKTVLVIWFILLGIMGFGGYYLHNNPIVIKEDVMDKINLNITNEKVIKKFSVLYSLKDTKIKFGTTEHPDKIHIKTNVNGKLGVLKEFKGVTPSKNFDFDITLIAKPIKTTNGIYVEQVKIIDFKSNDKKIELLKSARNLNDKWIEGLKEQVEFIINKILKEKPIYQFKDWKLKIAQSFIKDIEIGNGEIKVISIFN